MSEVTKKEEGKQTLPEGAIGKLEPDPTNPELKTVIFSIEIHVASNGNVFIDHEKALEWEASLRESNPPSSA